MTEQTNSQEQGEPPTRFSKWYANNKEKRTEYMREYRANNREACRAYGREHNAKKRKDKPEQVMLERSRDRAAGLGREFTITIDDINIPAVCPILGMPLVVNTGTLGANSPSLDRKDSALGYVPGNVWVISHRANSMKNAATPGQLKAFALWALETYRDLV